MSDSFEHDIIVCNTVPPELAAAPLVEVSGVVEALPVGIVHQISPAGSAGPMLMTRFERWRVLGGDLQSEPLGIIAVGEHRALVRLKLWLDPYAVRRVRARIVERGARGCQKTGLVEELIGPEERDRELLDYAERMMQPVILHDTVFGHLKLDRAFKWYVGTVVWNTLRLKIHISVNDDLDVSVALAAAHGLWSAQSACDAQMRRAVLEFLRRKKLIGESDAQANKLVKDSIFWRSAYVNAGGAVEFNATVETVVPDYRLRVRGLLGTGPKWCVDWD